MSKMYWLEVFQLHALVTSSIFSFRFDFVFPAQAISYGTALRTENERFRATKSVINLVDPKLVYVLAKFFSFNFHRGLQPKMGSHFRSTSAFETGV